MKRAFRFGLVFGLSAAIPALSLSAPFPTPPAATVASVDADYLRSLELQRRDKDLALAKIKSSADLTAYMGAMPKSSPLLRLSAAERGRFLQSLTFNEKGVTSFDYSDLQATLSASEIYEVLSLFGAQRVTPLIKGARINSEADRAIMASPSNMASPLQLSPGIGMGDDHDGYRCESPHTCVLWSGRICMSGC